MAKHQMTLKAFSEIQRAVKTLTKYGWDGMSQGKRRPSSKPRKQLSPEAQARRRANLALAREVRAANKAARNDAA